MKQPRIFKSYTELAAAQGDFIPMAGETRPESFAPQAPTQNDTSTDNGIAEAVAAAKSMEDFNMMYGSALDVARASEYGEIYSPGENIMETEFTAKSRDGIIADASEIASELKDAEKREEFSASATQDFHRKMKGVYRANQTVQQGVGLLTDAEIEKQDKPVPPQTRQDASVVRGYADMASRQKPTQYSDEREVTDKLKLTERMAKKQKRMV